MNKKSTYLIFLLVLVHATAMAQATAPIHEFRFNNSHSSQAGDISFGNNALFTNDRKGVASSAINLDGITSSAAIPNIPVGNSAFTISFWVKLNANAPDNINYVYHYGTSAAPSHRQNAVYLNVGANNAGAIVLNVASVNNLVTNTEILRNVWYHITVTHDVTSSKIYKNGTLLGSINQTLNVTFSNFNIGPFIGQNPNFAFQGAIDDLKIFDTALSQTEVTNNAGLIHEWKFNNNRANKQGNYSFVTNYTTFTTDRHGIANNALRIPYNASSSTPTGTYIDGGIAGLPVGNSPRTVSLWVKVNWYTASWTLSDLYDIFGYGTTDPGNAYGLSYHHLSASKYFSNYHTNTFGTTYTNIFTATNTLVDDVWYQLTVVYDGSVARIYRNGTLVGTSAATALNTASAGGIVNFALGKPISEVGGNQRNYFNGAIDDLKIYEQPLSAEQVLAVYNSDLLNPLPVTLTTFVAKVQENTTALTWSTASETNNNHFLVAHSTDGTVFKVLAKLLAKGESGADYSFTHQQPASGTNYYKLTQVDNDGTSSYLGMRTTNFNFAAQDVAIYPNPTSEKATVNFAEATFRYLKLVDISGKTLVNQPLLTQQNTASVDLTSYPNGLYVIQLIGDKETVVRKITKANP